MCDSRTLTSKDVALRLRELADDLPTKPVHLGLLQQALRGGAAEIEQLRARVTPTETPQPASNHEVPLAVLRGIATNGTCSPWWDASTLIRIAQELWSKRASHETRVDSRDVLIAALTKWADDWSIYRDPEKPVDKGWRLAAEEVKTIIAKSEVAETNEVVAHRHVHAICQAYESGMGHGLADDGMPNPYMTAGCEREAYHAGQQEGLRRHALKASDSAVHTGPDGHAMHEGPRSSCRVCPEGEQASEPSSLDPHGSLRESLRADTELLNALNEWKVTLSPNFDADTDMMDALAEFVNVAIANKLRIVGFTEEQLLGGTSK